MTLIKTVVEQDATNTIKKVYDSFHEKLGKVPNVIKLHSANPDTFGYFMGMLNLFANHPTLDPVLCAYLRTIIPHRYNGPYCVKFQSTLLKGMGETTENIELAKTNPKKLPMDEKRKSLLLFTLDMLDDSLENAEKQIEKLHKLEWSDEEIYSFCLLGGLQKGLIPLIQGFDVKHDF